MKKCFEMENIDIAWCAGCGNFSILKTLKDALYDLNIKDDSMYGIEVLSALFVSFLWKNVFLYFIIKYTM